MHYLEKKDALNLQLIPIDVKTSSAVPTADYINIRVDAAVNVKISDNEERLGLAAQNFLNQPTDYIKQVAREVLEGNMREIVGKMNLEEMVSDRQKFATLVKENLGVDNIVKIQKNAAISRAESEKEIARAQAIAKKEANDAQVSSELEIANAIAKAQKEKAVVKAEADRESKEAQINAETLIAQKENDLAIRKAELQKDADTKKAIADAAYQIQQETERKTVEIATADANLAKQEKAIMLQEKEVELTERTLEAKVKKQAEAEGIERKAEAMKQMGEAAVLEMYFKAMPEIARNIAEPLAKVDKITMYGEGNSAKLMKDIMGTLNQVTDGLKESTGIDLPAVLAGFAGAKIAENSEKNNGDKE